jgi:glycosyltransferase involved in cell wall biosynthesis
VILVENMKKIVFVIDTLFGGGAERVTAALANEFCKDVNNQIHIITYGHDESRDYSIDGRISRHEIDDFTGGLRVQRICKRIAQIRSMIKNINPYCVISLGSPIIVFPLVMSMVGLGYPLILSERNDPRQFPVSKKQRFFRVLCYIYCRGVVFQTAEAKAYFPKIIQKKSVVIRNPITSKMPETYQGERDSHIVNFCRLTSQKNLDLLIDSFSDICGEFPEHSLHIYGEGEEEARLQKKIDAMGLSDKAILHGYSNNIYDQIKKVSLFVASSDYEGISNSMLEAISLGIPSICTDCPSAGARETIRHGINGFLVSVGNRKELSETMKRVLSDDKLAHSIAAEGVKLRDEISIGEITKKWFCAICKFVD